MNMQELIEYCESLKGDLNKFINGVDVDKIIASIEQLDEPQPIKLKDVIVRIKQLDIGTRKVWLDEFLNKLGSDYGLLKYKAGYEQGKFETSMIPYSKPQEVTVPQCIAEHIERSKEIGRDLQDAMNSSQIHKEVDQWLYTGDNMDTFARAWLDGYTVEKEAKYTVKIKGNLGQYLGRYYLNNEELTPQFIRTQQNDPSYFTKAELEQTGFGWVFDCEGIEVEEVE